MKCIIAGGRDITDYGLVVAVVTASGWADEISEEVCGMQRGVDLLGKRWADERGIPVQPFEVTRQDWISLGKSAGPIRNKQMAKYATPNGALILVWDGKSSGSANMKSCAEQYGLKIYEHIIGE